MDGIWDAGTLRRKRYAAYRCTHCARFHQQEPARCKCGSYDFDMLLLKAADYCGVFGHNGSVTVIPNTERVEQEAEFALAERRQRSAVLSHKCRSYCSRCGMRKTRRRIKKAEDRPRS